MSRVPAPDSPALVYWEAGDVCCDSEWEAAYRRFETPAEEVRKFVRRFRHLGLAAWPKDLRLVDLFCGRGNGLVALARLGFTRLEGVDFSPALLREYAGRARLYVGDCRRLKFPDSSIDGVIIQGGLHHLQALPDDLARVLHEVARVLKPGGRVAIVEPWQTPFLRCVHGVCGYRLPRRLSVKLDALAAMTEREHATYFQWLARSEEILALLSRTFVVERKEFRWGKLRFVGRAPP